MTAPVAIAAAVALFGAAAAIHYARLGLTLAHYDARAHLVVARRVLDSLTPGWQQIGAVWLPLPHLLNLIPVQHDWLYRTGASAVAISIVSMAVAAWSIAWIVQRTTASIAGGVTAAALLMLNPNVLYLQSTPMSEPLLFATTFLSVALIAAWVSRVGPRSAALEPGAPILASRSPSTLAAGWASVAAVLTRYEAWPIVAAAIALAYVALLRRGMRAGDAFRAVRGLALWPLWAVAAFLVNSKVSVGAWFVSSGFFVAENPSLGHPWLAWREVWNGLLLLTGSTLPWAACAGAAIIVVMALRNRAHAPALVILALVASAALPWSAYLQGHPLRLRYDVPLIAAAAAIMGMSIALLPTRARGLAGAALIIAAVWQAPPFDRDAPVVAESQRDAANTGGRHAVSRYLKDHWDGSPIMMSMGSLGHYVHDLSREGFNVRDFLHEGNGEIWTHAVADPQPFAAWMLVEEKAEGGDALYWQGRLDPQFLSGYQRVAEGGGVVLYRRNW